MEQTQVEIILDKVSSIYTGRANACCCGCAGKHWYASQHQEWASKNRGYEVTSEDINDRAVKLLVNRMKKWQQEGRPFEFVEEGFVSMATETRVYILYFKH